MARKRQTRRWLQAHRADAFVRQARKANYRSRAAFKLLQIDQRDHLFRPGAVVVDLGAAPGGWSQVAAAAVGRTGCVVGVDILPVAPAEGATFVEGDITDPAVVDAVRDRLPGGQADLVISDMAPNITGIRSVDDARDMELTQTAGEVAMRLLRPGGAALIKVFHGEALTALTVQLKERFTAVVTRKPEASRSSSSEVYVLARGLRSVPDGYE